MGVVTHLVMSNDSTKPTGSWGSPVKFRKESITYCLLYILLVFLVSFSLDISIVSAVIWCALLYPSWWLARIVFSSEFNSEQQTFLGKVRKESKKHTIIELVIAAIIVIPTLLIALLFAVIQLADF